jgi:NOL1/NOP2/fmu family ribosome biogenesis protein
MRPYRGDRRGRSRDSDEVDQFSGGKELIKTSEVKESVIRYLEERFGLSPKIFDGYSLYLGPKCRVYLGPSAVPPSLRIVSPGLLIARADSGIKPSTNLFQLFGKHVIRNTISLPKEKVRDFVLGSDMIISKELLGDVSDGYVLIRYLDYELGCAMLKAGVLKNQVPKAKRLALKLI